MRLAGVRLTRPEKNPFAPTRRFPTAKNVKPPLQRRRMRAKSARRMAGRCSGHPAMIETCRSIVSMSADERHVTSRAVAIGVRLFLSATALVLFAAYSPDFAQPACRSGQNCNPEDVAPSKYGQRRIPTGDRGVEQHEERSYQQRRGDNTTPYGQATGGAHRTMPQTPTDGEQGHDASGASGSRQYPPGTPPYRTPRWPGHDRTQVPTQPAPTTKPTAHTPPSHGRDWPPPSTNYGPPREHGNDYRYYPPRDPQQWPGHDIPDGPWYTPHDPRAVSPPPIDNGGHTTAYPPDRSNVPPPEPEVPSVRHERAPKVASQPKSDTPPASASETKTTSPAAVAQGSAGQGGDANSGGKVGSSSGSDTPPARPSPIWKWLLAAGAASMLCALAQEWRFRRYRLHVTQSLTEVRSSLDRKSWTPSSRSVPLDDPRVGLRAFLEPSQIRFDTEIPIDRGSAA